MSDMGSKRVAAGFLRSLAQQSLELLNAWLYEACVAQSLCVLSATSVERACINTRCESLWTE